MSRFRKQSHTIWYCEYHIVWCPKYRYQVLAGKIKEGAFLHSSFFLYPFRAAGRCRRT
ncbi:MAG: transposase [Verrucomicrobia bacterium]|nr:transposase [Verrucomicrobiota bacterium]